MNSQNRSITNSATPGVRLSELMGALSIATDLGMGQSVESALASCVLAVRLAEKLHLGADDLRDVYYQALLRYIGCNAETHTLASIVGDELAMRHDFAAIDTARTNEVLALVLRYIRQANEGSSPLYMARMIARGMLGMREVRESFGAHCEVAQRLALRLGFGNSIVRALGQLYERWDGKGLPNGLKGHDVVPAVLVVTLAQDALTFYRLGGIDAAISVARERSGGAYEPGMADCFCKHAEELFAEVEGEPTWDTVIALEPNAGEADYLTGEQLDAAYRAMADFADLKSSYTLNHSPRVADLAAEAARRYSLPESDVVNVHRAAMLHDIGRVGVSVAIWDKPGPLTEREWERVRLHTYYTERILARPATLAQIGAIAALNHERLDGSGYHRGISGSMLSPTARIMAAADSYQAMTELRPHRPALQPEQAAAELKAMVHKGKLDGDIVSCVLAAAGHEVRAPKRAKVGGLTDREVEVLRLIARGRSIREIAADLTISPKTADRHIQNIYSRIGVSTRAGATLFATEHDLLR
ncbi:MAG TPA: HD domain-containing phosphohydrolase [Chloroflexia bacterium]|nr:HD domain-containing phosphohydrolase [Chloroflexia bacterium]